MKIEPENVQIGDRITVSGTVNAVSQSGTVVVLCDGGTGFTYLNLDDLAHAEITRHEKPLAVRDRVRTRTGATGVIVDLYRDLAWIEPEPGKVWPLTPDDRDAQPVRVSQLTRIEETADDAG